MFKYLNKFLAQISILFIKIYQFILSPDKSIIFSPFLKGKVCLHYPHCSQYCINSLKRFGFFPGIKYCFERVTSCHPFGKENKFFLENKIYEPEMYKIVFFSSATIGIPFLEKLLNDKRFEIVGLVTTPDKPAGRGQKLTPSPIKKYVLENNLNIPLFTPEKLKNNTELINKLTKLKPDFFVVISYGKIIPKNFLDIPIIAPINIHGSLLPKYRGASPIQSVILNNEPESGITIMKMNEKMDEGNIISKIKFKIPFHWTAKDIIEKMIQIGPEFTNDSIWKYARGEIQDYPQKHDEATYCKKIQKEDGKIDPFKDKLTDIYTKYKAFYLWPGIFFYPTKLNEKNLLKKLPNIIKITEIKINEDKFKQFKDKPLFLTENNKIILNPAIEEIKFKPEGKKNISWNEFKNGYIK